MATLQVVPHQVPSHWNTSVEYLPTPYLPSPSSQGKGGKGKTKHKMAAKQQANATTLCEELRASNCVYKSQGAPTKCIGPPLVQLGKNG